MVLVFFFIPAEWQGKPPIPNFFLANFPHLPWDAREFFSTHPA
jgi:hypothetical protein